MNADLLLNKFQTLPASAQALVLDFIEFISAKYTIPSKTKAEKNKKQHFTFKWEGSLSEFKNKFSSVELQHKAKQWRNS